MGVDLRLNSLVGRRSIIVLEDHLVALDHGQTRDRLRRYAFDRVDSVIMWWRMPWGPIVTFLLIFALPGSLLVILTGDTTAIVIGGLLLALAFVAETYFLLRRKATLRITRAGTDIDFVGTATPRRLNRFLDLLSTRIRQTQTACEQRALERAAQQTREPDEFSPVETEPLDPSGDPEQ